MKTHEQAMRGFVRCFSPLVEIRCDLCPYRGMKDCQKAMVQDVYNHIQQLEKRLADVNTSPFDDGMSQAEYFGNQSGLITGWNYPGGHDGRYYGATCSVCNRFVRQPGVLWRYCPLCGAKKEGGADG